MGSAWRTGAIPRPCHRAQRPNARCLSAIPSVFEPRSEVAASFTNSQSAQIAAEKFLGQVHHLRLHGPSPEGFGTIFVAVPYVGTRAWKVHSSIAGLLAVTKGEDEGASHIAFREYGLLCSALQVSQRHPRVRLLGGNGRFHNVQLGVQPLVGFACELCPGRRAIRIWQGTLIARANDCMWRWRHLSRRPSFEHDLAPPFLHAFFLFYACPRF